MIFLVIGFISGICTGLGLGGGTILIPALLFFTDLSQQEASAVNLIYFIPTGIAAIIIHRKKKMVETKNLWIIIIMGIIGATVGAIIAINFEPMILKKMFGIFLIFMGVVEIFKKTSKKA